MMFVSFLRAFKPGDSVIIQAEVNLSKELTLQITEMLDEAFEKLGIKYVLLPKGLKVVAREETFEEREGDPAPQVICPKCHAFTTLDEDSYVDITHEKHRCFYCGHEFSMDETIKAPVK